MVPFHHWLQRRREESGATQEEMAEALNCTQPTYCRYERGSRPPPFDRIMTIARHYTVQPGKVIALLPEKHRRRYLARLHGRQDHHKNAPISAMDMPVLAAKLGELRDGSDMDTATRSSVNQVLAWLKGRMPVRWNSRRTPWR